MQACAFVHAQGFSPTECRRGGTRTPFPPPVCLLPRLEQLSAPIRNSQATGVLGQAQSGPSLFSEAFCHGCEPLMGRTRQMNGWTAGESRGGFLVVSWVMGQGPRSRRRLQGCALESTRVLEVLGSLCVSVVVGSPRCLPTLTSTLCRCARALPSCWVHIPSICVCDPSQGSPPTCASANHAPRTGFLLCSVAPSAPPTLGLVVSPGRILLDGAWCCGEVCWARTPRRKRGLQHQKQGSEPHTSAPAACTPVGLSICKLIVTVIPLEPICTLPLY